MKYVVTCASGFEREAKQEILELLDHKVKVTSLHMKGLLLVIGAEKNSLDIFKKSDPTYLAHFYPFDKEVKITKDVDSIEKIVETVLKLGIISETDTFAVRCERRGNHKFKSREVERAVGAKIDAKVDLKNPKITVVVQILQDIAYVGIINTEDILSKTLKVSKKYEVRPVNRAEFKLREAIEEFKIELKSDWRALDIGASPGGWTQVLAEKVKEVVAVDSGELYSEVKKLSNVKHIKSRIENVKDLGEFDIIVNDMNVNPVESSQMMCNLANNLKSEGIVVMTIKFVTANRKKHIEEAQEILSKKYKNINFKKLKHNKFETTAFMVKK